MTRNELLEFMKSKVSKHYYELLSSWSKKRECRLFWKRKFKVNPAAIFNGYIVSVNLYDFIIIYP